MKEVDNMPLPIAFDHRFTGQPRGENNKYFVREATTYMQERMSFSAKSWTAVDANEKKGLFDHLKVSYYLISVLVFI
jgi:hypothetical protein